MPRARLYYLPRRGKIVTPFPTAVAPPPVVAPRFAHTSVHAAWLIKPRVFSPPFTIATTFVQNVNRAGSRVGLRTARGRIAFPVQSTLPPPGPAPLVPEFRRTRVISLRGLRTPRATTIFPIKPVLPPPPLPGKPQSSGGIVKDFLHWWRTGAE